MESMTRVLDLRAALACALLLAACHEQPPQVELATGANALKSITPTLSAEFGMDKPLVGPGGTNQGHATVAHDGTNFLVVWKDHRRGSRYDVYATRVDHTGKVLDPYGIAVATTAGSKDRPHVSFDGTNYLVVWEDFRNGVDFDIYGARVTPAGTVLDQNGIAICTATKGQHRPVAAHRAGTTLVVWEDFRNQKDYDIMGARLNAAGTVLDTGGISIATLGVHTKHPTVAAGPSGFLVAWTDSHSLNNDIRGTLVDLQGKVFTQNGTPICGVAVDKSYPWAAFDGTNFMVVWQDRRNAGGVDIFGTRVTSTGVVLDALGFAVSAAANEQEFPVLTTHAGGYLGVWQDRRATKFNDVHGALVSSAAKVTGSLTISDALNYQVKPYVAEGNKNTLAVWEDLRDGHSYAVYGARISLTGAVLDKAGIPISTTANQQAMAAVGAGTGGYLVVWQDRRSVASSPISQVDLFGVRVSSAGVVLDPAGIQITMAMDDQKEPAMAFGAGQYLVVWQDLRNASKGIDVYGARVSAAGNVLDLTGIPISSGAGERSAPAVAFDGKQFLVVWQDRRNSGTQYDIYGARVDSAGKVLDPAGIAVSKAAAYQRFPAVAHDGTRFLVVWQDRGLGNYDIRGARVDGTGKVLDPTGVVLSSAPKHQEYPAVTRGGAGNFMVVWQDRRGADRDIYGTRVTGAGKALDPSGIAIASLPKHQQSPAVSHDGDRYLVTWQDMQTGDPEVHGNLVDDSGKVLSAKGFSVAGNYSRSPAVGIGAKHQFLVAYHRFDPATTHGATRIRARMVTWKDQGGACSTDGQCKSGFCVDKKCCDTACGGGSGYDCQACSVTAGAAKDGTCGPIKKGNICRPTAGFCDQAETCDGKSPSCPPDTFLPVGTACPGGSCVTGGVCKPAGPDMSLPDLAPPDLAPDLNVPDVNVPDVNVPDVNVPDVAVPDVNVPDVNVPDVNVPDVAVPDVNVPDVNVPDVNVPDVAVDLVQPPDQKKSADMVLPDTGVDQKSGPDQASPDKGADQNLPPDKAKPDEAVDSKKPDTVAGDRAVEAAEAQVADWRRWDRAPQKADSFVPGGPGKREPEGCSCGVGDTPSGTGGGLWLLLGLGLLLSRRGQNMRRTRAPS